jgi:hypothetical protein
MGRDSRRCLRFWHISHEASAHVCGYPAGPELFHSPC